MLNMHHADHRKLTSTLTWPGNYTLFNLLHTFALQHVHAPSNLAGLQNEALYAWCVMPGWAPAAEALHRVGYKQGTLQDAYSAVITAGRSFLDLKTTQDLTLTSLSQRISLAATSRKLLWPHIQHDREVATDRKSGWRCMRFAPAAEKRTWRDGQAIKLSSACVGDLVLNLTHAVSRLDFWLAICRGEESSGSCIGSGSSTSSQSSQHRTEGLIPQTQFTAVRCSQFDETEARQHSRGVPHQQSLLMLPLLLKLQAIYLVTLVQLCRWIRECEVTESHTPRSSMVLDIVLNACNTLSCPGLKVVTTLQLTEMRLCVPSVRSEVSVVWERYAVAQFDGRMLPGCCHLGCTNLSGLSEAALHTQLCKGCRRARYCSVGCQRAAWLEGGHSKVCGE